MSLDESTWRGRMARHEARVDALVDDHVARRERGERHPVHDFLFTYYSFRPSQLRRWHPGFGETLTGRPPHADWRHYRTGDSGVSLDSGYVHDRAETVRWVRSLLAATASRTPQLGCFGMHEWAMVYQTSPADIRHQGVPLRLGHRGTDEVVESQPIRCTHFDAFRFFTESARPRNASVLTRERQVAMEQPGCLHANMDLYKWSYKLSPLVPSELVLDAFVLARDVRELDMRASPYDLSGYGYEPVRIETREGKAEYVAAQRSFADRAAELRDRIATECERITIGDRCSVAPSSTPSRGSGLPTPPTR